MDKEEEKIYIEKIRKIEKWSNDGHEEEIEMTKEVVERINECLDYSQNVIWVAEETCEKVIEVVQSIYPEIAEKVSGILDGTESPTDDVYTSSGYLNGTPYGEWWELNREYVAVWDWVLRYLSKYDEEKAEEIEKILKEMRKREKAWVNVNFLSETFGDGTTNHFLILSGEYVEDLFGLKKGGEIYVFLKNDEED